MMLTNREIYHNKAIYDMTDYKGNLVIYIIMSFTPLICYIYQFIDDSIYLRNSRILCIDIFHERQNLLINDEINDMKYDKNNGSQR